jgi:hypothetical protein
MRKAASWCQPLQESVVPVGAETVAGEKSLRIMVNAAFLMRRKIHWNGCGRRPLRASLPQIGENQNTGSE